MVLKHSFFQICKLETSPEDMWCCEHASAFKPGTWYGCTLRGGAAAPQAQPREQCAPLHIVTPEVVGRSDEPVVRCPALLNPYLPDAAHTPLVLQRRSVHLPS